MYIFFFNDTATTEIYTLSLHDALPISGRRSRALDAHPPGPARTVRRDRTGTRTGSPQVQDRKSTRLNSSHDQISYAVFCLKKKKKYIYMKTCSDIVRTPKLQYMHTLGD